MGFGSGGVFDKRPAAAPGNSSVDVIRGVQALLRMELMLIGVIMCTESKK